MISKPTPVLSETPTLKRNLGLWAVVGLGLGYMTPTVVFDTFGMVARDTHNLVPTAYLLALVVMVFTAISYAKMSRVIPSAGSAFSCARVDSSQRRIHGGLDLVGGLHPFAHGELPHHQKLS